MNPLDNFYWSTEAIGFDKEELTVTIIGTPKAECMPFRVNKDEMKLFIHNRINNYNIDIINGYAIKRKETIISMLDTFYWSSESISSNYGKIIVTLYGTPKAECMPFRINFEEIRQEINTRMNSEVKMKETMNPYETIIAKAMLNSIYGNQSKIIPQIKNVIFNPPATIVFWTDGTKTVVKCDERDQFDPEKGITMAFFKKMHGNKGHYFEEIKKWREKYNQTANKKTVKTDENPKWYILYRIGTPKNTYVYDTVYSTKYNAIRHAKKMFLNASSNVSWAVVSKKGILELNTDDKDIEWHRS